MALRRVLPSRATPDKAPESAATPATSASASPAKSAQRPLSETHAIPPLPEVTYDMPNPAAENAPAPSRSVAQSVDFAAAATSAFGTLPTAAPARVLEDSFVKTPVIEEEPAATAPALTEVTVTTVTTTITETTPQPVPEVAAEPAPVFSAPGWDVPAEPAPAPQPVPEVAAEPAPVFSAPAWDTPAAEAPAPALPPEPVAATPVEAAPMPVETPAANVFSAPGWDEPASALASVPEPAPAPEPEPAAPEPAPAPQSAAPQSFQPSRPDNNQLKRRVREKRPRDFTAMGSPENQKPEKNTPDTSFAPSVPVHTRTLATVDEDLIATGIMEGPAADSLTGSLPGGVAEMTFAPPVQPAAAPQPAPEPVPQPEPAPAPIVIPVAAPEPVIIPVPEPVIIRAPEPAPLPEPVPMPAPAPKPEPIVIPEIKPAGIPIPMPEPVVPPAPVPAAPTPSFLSNAAPGAPAAAPLPPPQSDLPWTQAAAAADWEIETPESDGWAPDTGHETTPTGASHMPPPADLYKPMGGSGSSAPQMPPSGLPPRTGNNFTPELPGQRRKSGGGSPWAFIAIVVLVVAGAGAWYLHGKGGSKSEAQLASLTKAPAADASGALLPPPVEGAAPNTANASFYSPPLPATAGTDTSSSAVVAFADVPPEQANQPIVATGKEEIPANMNLMDKFKAEVEKARAIKAGEIPADTSASAVAAATKPSANATAPLTPDKLQEELAAYRSALAQNPTNPVTPAAFRKDPDGYMDGKAQQTTDGQLASGALLPPPTGNGGVLPPPDLYTNNPKNLPVVAEPIAQAPQRVRTLSDFPDIEPYAPEREKVEIPKNMKPKMAATDFPALEVLSFVPGKGIVAYADGREGVLLIGESINGWELVNVAPDNAQFKAGQKSYQVTADNN